VAENTCANQVSISATGFPSLPGPLVAKYFPTSTQPSYLSVSLFDEAQLSHGLFATVYSDLHFNNVISNRVVSLNASAASPLRSRLKAPSYVSFAARLRGTIMVNLSGTCIASSIRESSPDAVFALQLSVFVLSAKIIEATGLSSSAIAATGAFFVSSVLRLYDIYVHHSETCSPSCGDSTALDVSITCSSAATATSTIVQIYALHSLLTSGLFDASAYPTVHPSAPCTSTSFIFGESFSVATAGIANRFSVRVQDAYSNPVDQLSQFFSAATMLCPTAKVEANTTICTATGSLVIVQHAPKVAGPHGKSVSVNGAGWLAGVVAVVPVFA
jgi:hypothetical protein